MKISFPKSLMGLTLIETLISISVGSFMLGAVLTAGVALQRSSFAVQGYSIAESDQLRVLDYIAMDCRRATDVCVNSNVLTVTLPVYYSGGAPVTPVLAAGKLSYAPGMVQIVYAQNGSNFDRTINTYITGCTGCNCGRLDRPATTTTTHIATNVATFNVAPLDQSTTAGTVSCNITFAPRFTYLAAPGPINGTTVYTNIFLRNAQARQ